MRRQAWELQELNNRIKSSSEESEADSNTGLRSPLLPPTLALPAFQGSDGSGNGLVRYESSEDNREELQEERARLIQRYSGGELQFLIDWDLEEIRRELDSVEEELKRKPSA